MKIFDQCPECSTTRPMPDEHVPVHALDDLVGDLVVRRVPPPGEHVGLGQHLLGQPVLRVVEGRRADDAAVAEVLLDALRDGRVHALRVDLRHVLLDLLVAVLAPHRHPHAGRRFLMSCETSRHLTAPAVVPAAT